MWGMAGNPVADSESDVIVNWTSRTYLTVTHDPKQREALRGTKTTQKQTTEHVIEAWLEDFAFSHKWGTIVFRHDCDHRVQMNKDTDIEEKN